MIFSFLVDMRHSYVARHVRHFKRNFRVKEAPIFSRAPSQEPDSRTEIDVPLDLDDNSLTGDWLAQPFNAQFARCGIDRTMPGSGLAIDSLDFLWNMTT